MKIKKNQKSKIGFFLFVIFLTSSCYVLHYPISETESQKAKNMPIPEGKSLLYVYRNFSSMVRPYDSLDVMINKTHMPRMLGGEFFLCMLDSGKYVVKGFTERDEILVYSIPGQKYYIKAIPIARFADTGCRVELQDMKTGIADVSKCTLLGITNSEEIAGKKSINRLPWEKISFKEYKKITKANKKQ